MLISSQTSALTKDPESAEKYLPMFSSAGFNAVDFDFCDIYKNEEIKALKNSKVFDLEDEKLHEYFSCIKKELNKNSLVVGQTHSPFPTAVLSANNKFNKYLFEIHKKCIEITAEMGCKYIVIHPIFNHYENRLSKDEEKRINIKFFSALIPALKKYNVIACLENMWIKNNGKIMGAVCADFYEAKNYIDELNSIAGKEMFGFCFDFGHAVLCSADIESSVKLLGKRIKTVHIHDVDGVNDSHTTPFLGVGDFKCIFNALKEIGFEGSINFEAAKAWEKYPEEVYKEAIALLGAVGKYLINKYFL